MPGATGLAAAGAVYLMTRPSVRRFSRLSGEIRRWRQEARRIAEGARLNGQALDHCTGVLRLIASALPVGVVAIDRDARIELWNHAAGAILGYAADEMIGQPAPTQVFMSAAAEDDSAADVFLRVVTGQSVKSEEVTCRRKDGTAVEASFSGAPLIDDDERVRGAICVFEDISHRRSMARALHQAQKMEAVGQLTGGIAHDFNNILGIAIGNLDLLAEELGNTATARTAALVDNAQTALLRGAELTRSLLAFARRQPLRPTIVDVGELLSAITRVLARVLGEQVQVVVRLDPVLWPVVADPAQLEAAITNLAINARDAMPSGGQLTISAVNACFDDDVVEQIPDMAPGDYTCIEIHDTGTGMSAEVLAHAFEPFFTTKALGQGTGLGLSMVYGFARQSGGQVRVYSELKVGTTVRLYLPRASGEPPRNQKVPHERPQGRGETVLAVDDNEKVRSMVAAQMTRLGYRVIEAGCAADALATLDGLSAVDLLFTDIVMPHGMDGFTLADEARLRRPGLKVLFTSGFPGTTLTDHRRLAGSDDFIGKPFRLDDLALAVRRVIDREKEQI